jgi:hypothetical protein
MKAIRYARIASVLSGLSIVLAVAALVVSLR